MSFDRTKLELEKTKFSIAQAADEELASQALELVIDSDKYNYAYQWTWCDLPILQLPQDVMATQEVIFRCRPTLIIETGVAWGGGIALYATSMDAYGGGRIIGIDLNLAESVSSKVKEIETRSSIEFIKGSSTDESVVRYVLDLITPEDRVMVVLDSNHTHAHVLDELRVYGPLVSPGQYCIVSDTIVEFIPEQAHRPRPWGHGNNPMTAVRAYLDENETFKSDRRIDRKVLMSFNPQGYLLKL